LFTPTFYITLTCGARIRCIVFLCEKLILNTMPVQPWKQTLSTYVIRLIPSLINYLNPFYGGKISFKQKWDV
ncbi:hypothetical protein L9F63_006746, partial [Diploptera punctata]